MIKTDAQKLECQGVRLVKHCLQDVKWFLHLFFWMQE